MKPEKPGKPIPAKKVVARRKEKAGATAKVPATC